MAVKLRLRRMGRRKRPQYAVVAADTRSPRDGRFIEDLGRYEPLREPASVDLKNERILYWLEQGAQPSETVRSLLSKEGLMLELHLRRKGAEPEAIQEAVAAHRAAIAEKLAGSVKLTAKERRKAALEAEAKAAKEKEAELAKLRAEAEEKARKEAEEARKKAEADRKAAAEEAKKEQEAANKAQAEEDADAPAEAKAEAASKPEADRKAAADEAKKSQAAANKAQSAEDAPKAEADAPKAEAKAEAEAPKAEAEADAEAPKAEAEAGADEAAGDDKKADA